MTPINWKAVRDDYEDGLSSLSALERKHSVSRQAIRKRANKENWVTPVSKVAVTPDKQGVPNRDANAGMRAANALALRANKLTYQQIADKCGYADASTCRKAIMRELDRVVVENASELRREESYILDQWHAECSKLWQDESNKGRLFALDRLLVISKDRRSLFNLDKRPEEDVSQQNYTKRIILQPTIPTGGDNGSSNG